MSLVSDAYFRVLPERTETDFRVATRIRNHNGRILIFLLLAFSCVAALEA